MIARSEFEKTGVERRRLTPALQLEVEGRWLGHISAIR
jgi:hypothetical protein